MTSYSKTLPPLPDLPPDAVLEVYTHSSLKASGFPDNSRLAVLGEAQMKASLIKLLLMVQPPMECTEIMVSRDAFSHGRGLTIDRLQSSG